MEIGRLLDQVRLDVQSDPDGGELDHLARRKRDLEGRIAALRGVRQSPPGAAGRPPRSLDELAPARNLLPLEGLREALVVDDMLLAHLRSGTDEERLEAMQKLAARFNELWRDVEQRVVPLKQEVAGAETRLRQLASIWRTSPRDESSGSISPLPGPRRTLGDRVEQLGRLIEVKPEAERWWPALELFLGRHRSGRRGGHCRRPGKRWRSSAAPRRGANPSPCWNPSEARELSGNARNGSLLAGSRSPIRSPGTTSGICWVTCSASRQWRKWKPVPPDGPSPRTDS